jgi:hypothetical protein
MFYDIQRLTAPTRITECFNLTSGLLLREGRTAINNVIGFDYMGNSTFEWGALGKTVDAYIAQLADGEIQAKTFQILATHTHSRIKDTRQGRVILQRDFSAVKDVYTLAPKSIETELEAFLKIAAASQPRTAEFTCFRESLFTPEIRTFVGKKDIVLGERFVGWLDIQSASFFFRDRDSYEKMAIASGLDPI